MRGARCVVSVVLLTALSSSLAAQATGEWIRPYPQVPTYWELVGRLFPDTPALRRDRGFRGFLDPSVLVAASVLTNVREGQLLANFNRLQIIQAENVLNADLPPDRLVTAELTQVRFTAADKDSLRLDVRNGNPSSEFQQCADARLTRFSHLADARIQSVVLCEGALFWTSWRPQVVPLDVAGKGSLSLDNIGVMQLTYDAAATEISASVQVR